ncbi:MAG: hypothetical protein LUD81_10015 [Clostridiales bacterium]|nr:hypothetical protein [Clostridiales bacterium]
MKRKITALALAGIMAFCSSGIYFGEEYETGELTWEFEEACNYDEIELETMLITDDSRDIPVSLFGTADLSGEDTAET